MKVLSRIDQTILRLFEAVAHFVQLRSTINNFNLAQGCLHMSALIVVVHVVLLYQKFGLTAAAICIALLGLAMMVNVAKQIHICSIEAKKSDQHNFINIRAHLVVWILMRIVLSLLTLYYLFNLLVEQNINSVLTFALVTVTQMAYYFMSCTPLPPGTLHEQRQLA